MSAAKRIVIGGASGFLGSHLCSALRERGHDVIRLVRRPARGADESTWDPTAGRVDADLVGGADVVVNLAGSPTLGNPHSRRWAQALRTSRIQTTSLLASTIAAATTPPAFLAGNGISWYGDHGAAPLPETADTRGIAFLTQVTRDWEAAARPAIEGGARVCILRTAPVMDAASAPLSLLRPLFAAGLGGRLGEGEQFMPMITLRDWVAAVVFLAEHPSAAGPVNLSCPVAPTNTEFTRALGRHLRRPTFAAVPSPALRLVAGAMAPELLGSMRAVPQALLDLGYEFQDPDIDAILTTALPRS